ncbi:hypothetical protein [Heyndrickxia camelliae]|uniref:Uncharacterized protein n=1 Tax=Heyndrickxia camelliae TaxID=1707093 RepID=A0A2N3LE70_9BACI|nr:hypothetical protein [Heyndrickxia camelliae]PKR82889.1 hypothetical protein CWO92_22120 [Heyndrickxia camelliae]
MNSRNIETTIINDRYISSAEIERNYEGIGRFYSYETFVWEYDKKSHTRRKLLYQTYQNTYTDAINVHLHFIRNFCKNIIDNLTIVDSRLDYEED